jgi:hypothetical protein
VGAEHSRGPQGSSLFGESMDLSKLSNGIP